MKTKSIEDINRDRRGDSDLIAVSRFSKKDAHGNTIEYLNCICKCGNKKVVRYGDFIYSKTASCGCGFAATRHRKYSRAIPALQNIWQNMKDRCYKTSHISYPYYGAKGVVVCEEWLNDYQKFLDWALANGWRVGLQIDKDTLGDGKLYSPQTCCFLTPKQNSNRRKNNIYVEWKGKRMTVAEVCELEGFNTFRMYARISQGIPFEEAIKIPVRKRKINVLVEYMGQMLTFREISRRTGAYYPQLVHNFRKRKLSMEDSIKESIHAA